MIRDNYHYDQMREELKVLDEEFVLELRSKPKDSELIRNHVSKILENADHAIGLPFEAFYKKFHDKYVLEDSAWLNLKDCLIDINFFLEKLVDVYVKKWKNSYLNTEFARGIVESLFKVECLMHVFDHLIQVYRLQSDNKEKEKQVEKLYSITLEDLNLRNELCLPSEEDPYNGPIYSLNEILQYRDPAGMMQVISKTEQGIRECLKNVSNVSDEELLPIYLYVIVRANIPELASFLSFIEDFGDKSQFDDDAQFGYSMLRSALKWCMNVDPPPQRWGVEQEVSQVDEKSIQGESEEVEGQDISQELEEKKSEIKDLEAEMDLLYKELQNHMQKEHDAEEEIVRLKARLASYEKATESSVVGRPSMMNELQAKLKKVEPKVVPTISSPPQEFDKSVSPLSPKKIAPVVQNEVPPVPEPQFIAPSKNFTEPVAKSDQKINVINSDAYVLPVTVVLSESINIQYQGKTLDKYDVTGEIGVRSYKNDTKFVGNEVKFKLNILGTSRISLIGNNQKLSSIQQSKDEIVLDCKVPLTNSSLEYVGLMKYNAAKDYEPLPVKIQSVFKLNKSSLDVMLQYVINPEYFKEFPLETFSIKVKAVVTNSSGQSVNLKKCVSKPHGTFDETKGTLEWVFTDVHAADQPQKLILQFIHELDDVSGCIATIPATQAKYTCAGKALLGLEVDGCNGKKSKSGDIFLGGLEQKISQGSLIVFNTK